MTRRHFGADSGGDFDGLYMCVYPSAGRLGWPHRCTIGAVSCTLLESTARGWGAPNVLTASARPVSDWIEKKSGQRPAVSRTRVAGQRTETIRLGRIVRSRTPVAGQRAETIRFQRIVRYGDRRERRRLQVLCNRGNGMDDEERRRLDRLDYSTDSAERPYGAPDHDERAPQEHDGRSDYRTSFEASDAPNETVERNGETYEKWRWLAQLNQNGYSDHQRDAKRQAERRRDVEILVQSTNEWAAEQGDDQVVNVRRVFTLLDALVDGADEDYRFGPNNPVEVAVLAALSLAANEEQWMIRQTDLFDEFMSTYVPDDSAADRGDIMRMRQRIRDALSTVDDKD